MEGSLYISVTLSSMWTVGIPIYFLFEAFHLYRFDNKNFEQHKFSQELGSKVWIAASTVLDVLFAGKNILARIGGGKGN